MAVHFIIDCEFAWYDSAGNREAIYCHHSSRVAIAELLMRNQIGFGYRAVSLGVSPDETFGAPPIMRREEAKMEQSHG